MLSRLRSELGLGSPTSRRPHNSRLGTTHHSYQQWYVCAWNAVFDSHLANRIDDWLQSGRQGGKLVRKIQS